MAPIAEGRVCWPLAWWPEGDRAAWELGCTPADPFDDGERYGAGLRPGSLEKLRKGYGRWLSFLHSRDWLDPTLLPLERVTRPRLRAYFRTLRRNGNADHTIVGRFTELTMTMKIMASGEDVSWICRPDGASIYVLLPRLQRVLTVPDSRVLFAWGLEIMESAATRPTARERLTRYRDGLLIALFAACGRRLGSVALLRPGQELIERDGQFRIELAPEQVKNRRRDHFGLPEELTPYLRHYLGVVRPALLERRSEEALWVSGQGTALPVGGIQNRIGRLTLWRFGRSFGPHRFRYAIATTVAHEDPGNHGLAAGVLNNSPAVTEQHYNRAGQYQAGLLYEQLLEGRRRGG